MTDAQRKKLVCLLRERDLWDDRHKVCNCLSLTALTKDQAAACITRLAGDFPEHPRPRPRRPRLLPGTIRPATERQRSYILYLCPRTGWSAEKTANWLFSRYRVADVAATPMSSTTAHQVISALEQVVRKSGAGIPAGHTPAPTAEVPL
jgi:hypothetical protein